MEALINEYEQTLRSTIKIKKALEKRLQPFKEIYQNKRMSMQERFKAKEASADLRNDLSVVSSWERNIQYSLEWMRTARCPGSTRGIERRAAYEREKPFDPLLMQRFFRSIEPIYFWDKEPKENVITPSEKQVISKVLKVLTDKELEVYLMARGNSFSQYKIANLMDISRASVQTMIKRADKKIAKILSTTEEGNV
jgi:positive control factor